MINRSERIEVLVDPMRPSVCLYDLICFSGVGSEPRVGVDQEFRTHQGSPNRLASIEGCFGICRQLASAHIAE